MSADETIEVQADTFALIPDWAYDRLEHDPHALRLYVYLAGKVINCRTRQGFRKISDLAEHFGVTDRTVKRWLATCVTAGVILTKQTRRSDGNWGRNVYFLPRDNPATVAEFDIGPPPTGGHRTAPTGGHPLVSTGDTGGHEASLDRGTPGVPSGIKTPQVLPNGRDQKKTSSSSEARIRASRLPEDFEPTEEMKDWVRQNAPEVDGWTEHEKFMDHFLSVAGPNSRKTDWVRAWRNWMRRANEQRYRRPSVQQFKTAHEKRQESMDRAGSVIDRAVALVEKRGGSRDDNRAVYEAMQEVKAADAAGRPAGMVRAYIDGTATEVGGRFAQLELTS